MLLCVWIARPAMMNATFSTFIIPCLGFLFLPFTTLMYVFLMQGVGTIQGLDWLWLFLAVMLDIASIGAAGATQPQSHPRRLSWLVPAELGSSSSACCRDWSRARTCGSVTRPGYPHPVPDAKPRCDGAIWKRPSDA